MSAAAAVATDLFVNDTCMLSGVELTEWIYRNVLIWSEPKSMYSPLFTALQLELFDNKKLPEMSKKRLLSFLSSFRTAITSYDPYVVMALYGVQYQQDISPYDLFEINLRKPYVKLRFLLTVMQGLFFDSDYSKDEQLVFENLIKDVQVCLLRSFDMIFAFLAPRFLKNLFSMEAFNEWRYTQYKHLINLHAPRK